MLLIYTDILDVDLCSAQYMINILLNSVSSQCARGKSSLAWKPEIHPPSFNNKPLFKNVILQILNFILISYIIKYFPHMVQC